MDVQINTSLTSGKPSFNKPDIIAAKHSMKASAEAKSNYDKKQHGSKMRKQKEEGLKRCACIGRTKFSEWNVPKYISVQSQARR